MSQGPGYMFAQALAPLGAKVIIHGTTQLPGGGESEAITVILDGVAFAMDVEFDEVEGVPTTSAPRVIVECPACRRSFTCIKQKNGPVLPQHAGPGGHPCAGSGVTIAGSGT